MLQVVVGSRLCSDEGLPLWIVLLRCAGGQYSARIRSLCQFFNSTDMTLEVALLEEDDSTWTVLPYSASAGGGSPGSGPKRPAVGDVMEEEVFEYERYLPLRGWSPDHLKGLDPHRYCRQRDGSRGSSSFPKVQLPQVSSLTRMGRREVLALHEMCCHISCPVRNYQVGCRLFLLFSVNAEVRVLGVQLQPLTIVSTCALQGWEWEGPWEVEIHGNVDADGWAYAFEPRQFRWPPEPGAGIKKAHDFVRRYDSCRSHCSCSCFCCTASSFTAGNEQL